MVHHCHKVSNVENTTPSVTLDSNVHREMPSNALQGQDQDVKPAVVPSIAEQGGIQPTGECTGSRISWNETDVDSKIHEWMACTDVTVFEPYFCTLIGNAGAGKSIILNTAIAALQTQYSEAVVAIAPTETDISSELHTATPTLLRAQDASQQVISNLHKI
jgi:hypothetical protein